METQKLSGRFHKMGVREVRNIIRAMEHRAEAREAELASLRYDAETARLIEENEIEVGPSYEYTPERSEQRYWYTLRDSGDHSRAPTLGEAVRAAVRGDE